MPYGQKERGNLISIDIYALRAKERIKFNQFQNSNSFKIQSVSKFNQFQNSNSFLATTKVINF